MGSRGVSQPVVAGRRALTGPVGIVTALAAEARTLGSARRLPGGLRALPDGSLLAVSGMGFEAAERSARALADAECGALVSWGLAGGLDPQLSAGTVIVPEWLSLDRAPDLSAHAAWRESVRDVLGSAAVKAVAAGGKLLTSRRALASTAEKRKAFLESRASAVEMESYAVAAVAAGSGLPFIAIRVIVDTATDEVPAGLLDAADDRGRIAVGRLLVSVLGSPRLIAPLLGLAKRYRVARRVLSAAARAGAPGRVPERRP